MPQRRCYGLGGVGKTPPRPTQHGRHPDSQPRVGMVAGVGRGRVWGVCTAQHSTARGHTVQHNRGRRRTAQHSRATEHNTAGQHSKGRKAPQQRAQGTTTKGTRHHNKGHKAPQQRAQGTTTKGTRHHNKGHKAPQQRAQGTTTKGTRHHSKAKHDTASVPSQCALVAACLHGGWGRRLGPAAAGLQPIDRSPRARVARVPPSHDGCG